MAEVEEEIEVGMDIEIRIIGVIQTGEIRIIGIIQTGDGGNGPKFQQFRTCHNDF